MGFFLIKQHTHRVVKAFLLKIIFIRLEVKLLRPSIFPSYFHPSPAISVSLSLNINVYRSPFSPPKVHRKVAKVEK
jgi:hypothetical protein